MTIMASQDAQYGDIRATLAVSQDESRTGSSRVVNLPGGRSVTIAVPAGIQDGAELRMPGMGDASGPGGKAGDLILRISVITANLFENRPWADPSIPTAELSNPFLASSNQGRTEFAPGGPGYLPPANLQPPATSAQNFAVTEAMSRPQYAPPPAAYQPAPVAPQYQGYNQAVPFDPTYPPSQALRPQPKRSSAVTVLVSLIVLVLIVGSGTIYYFGYYQPAQAQRTAAATSQSVATSAAQVAQITAQAAASSTAQAQATAQAHQDDYTRATSGTPALNDAMSSPTGSQWEELNSSAHGVCGYSAGSYHSTMPTAGFFQPCFAKNTHFSNFAFQVNMTITQGDQGGIIFRADEVNNKFYLFNIGVDGAYNLYLYVNNQGTQAQTLLSGTSTLIKLAGQNNEITLLARGSSLSFYINRQYLTSITDSTYSTGMIGLFGESKTQATNVAFSNVKVWTL